MTDAQKIAAHEALVDALRAAIAKLEKVATWLESNAKILEDAAKSHDRFQSIADEELKQANNYRLTASDLRKQIETCRAALSLATQKGDL